MKKATALLKKFVTTLRSIAKAKSLAIKSKSEAVKARLLMLSLMKHRKLGFGSISNKIHNLLGTIEDQEDEGSNNNKAIVLYNDGAPSSSVTGGIVDIYDDDDKYPDLRHTLFDGEDEFGDLDDVDQAPESIINMVKNSKEEEGGNFILEDEIDHVADLFISRFHKQMRLQKLLSFKRYQEMLSRGT